jgi:hypothetical protein
MSTRLKQRAVTEEGDQFIFNIVTGDESRIHHFDPKKKRLSMQYRHTSSLRLKKFKTMPSAGKILLTVCLGLTKSLHDRIFGSWEYCQFSSVD